MFFSSIATVHIYLNKKNIILLSALIKIIFHQSLSKSSLTFSLPSQPISLFLSSLLRLYYQPLVILSRTFSNCEIGLSLLIVVVVFLTTVGSFRISVLMLGFTIMCTNGAFKVQKDLFLDDQEPANSGLFSFLGSVASFATARGRPTPPIRLRPTSLLPIRPTSLPPIRPTPTLSSSPKPNSVIGAFFILFVIGDFLFCLVWIEEKD